MRKNIIHTTILGIILLIFITNSTNAQVTIGSGNPTAKGALLEIKSQEADANNITSEKGGLGLPRVKLTNRTTLEPFISTTDTEWVNATTTKIKEKHAGLVVYNLHESPASETNADKILRKGVYIWDGSRWNTESLNQKRYFHLPSFNIPLSAIGTGLVFDLYGEYERQFTKNALANPTFVSSNSAITTVPSPLNGRLYTREELDYVITYYDDNILDEVKVLPNGTMTYDVISINTTPDSYMNVVFIVK